MHKICSVALLLSCVSTYAGNIREFDLKTAERLGNELTRVSQTPDKGATNEVRKRARERERWQPCEAGCTKFSTITLC